MLTIGSLFAGYGGIELALASVLDVEPAWFSEVEAAPSKILAHHWPDVPNHGDVTKIDWYAVEPVDIITGGSPCQDLSHAGKRAGMRPGTRSGLWASMCDAIDIIRPRLVVWENVRGALSAEADSELEHCPGCMGDGGQQPVLRALGRVLGDLSELGYDAWWYGLRAADVGFAHGRFRIFLFATPAGDTGRIGRDEAVEHDGGRSPQGHGGSVPDEPDRDALRAGPVGVPGQLTLLPTPAVNDEQRRITERAEVEPGTGCWIWTGWTNDAATPYGRVSIAGRKVYAHRASYEAFIGPIPEGHEIDHLCQNSLCVNPEHLEAVTPSENRDRVTQRRTHCKRGHEFTEENTYWVREGARACRACRAWQDKVQKARRKGQTEPEIVLLPTPACNDMGKSYTPEEWDAWTATMQAKHGNGNGHGKSLEIEAQRLLPTPTTSEGNGAGDHGTGALDLRTTVSQLLPTPRAQHGKPRNQNIYYRPAEQPQNLENALYHLIGDDRGHSAVQQDWREYEPAIRRQEAIFGRLAPLPTETGKSGKRRLSPLFVEWLMGLPAGHVTDVPGVTRNDQLKALGNGVVPQQCAAALRAFLADAAKEHAA